MGIAELVLIAIGLSMDAFAVSVCKGLASRKADFIKMFKCGIWFGGFQGLMPLIGFFLGRSFEKYITAIDHWIAFAILALIGINMLREAFSSKDESDDKDDDYSAGKMFTLAVATSIDALAVGISFALAGDTNIWIAVALIGVITFVLSFAGVKIGVVFGNKFEKGAQIMSGVILILIGTKILLEHLGVINF